MPARSSRPSALLRSFAEETCGGKAEFRDVSWPHGESTVWAVERGGTTVAFLKKHRRTKKFEAELRAYRKYVPALEDAAPQLMGVYEGTECALLISVVPGQVASCTDWPADREYELHVRAARLLRRLHDVPVDEEQRSEVEAQTRGALTSWFDRARAYLPPDVMEWAIERIEAGIAEAPPICVCHKDFSPRNWISTSDGNVGLIDFERTRVDFQCLDWSRLWMREWMRRPDLEEAFFIGYGEVDPNWEASMRKLMTLDAVAGVAWALEHDELKFADENRALIARLRRSAD